MSGIETKSESETDKDVDRPSTQQSKAIVLQIITNNYTKHTCELCGKSHSHKSGLSKHIKKYMVPLGEETLTLANVMPGKCDDWTLNITTGVVRIPTTPRGDRLFH